MSATGDRQIAIVYADHRASLLRFLLTFTNGEKHTAEDLLQETMLRAWRHLATLPSDRDGLQRWLFTVARRVAIDAARRRRARPSEVDLAAARDLPLTEDTEGTVLAGLSLRTAFKELQPWQRELLTELYGNGLSVEQAALRFDIPVGTVRSRAHYALRAVRTAVTGG